MPASFLVPRPYISTLRLSVSVSVSVWVVRATTLRFTFLPSAGAWKPQKCSWTTGGTSAQQTTATRRPLRGHSITNRTNGKRWWSCFAQEVRKGKGDWCSADGSRCLCLSLIVEARPWPNWDFADSHSHPGRSFCLLRKQSSWNFSAAEQRQRANGLSSFFECFFVSSSPGVGRAGRATHPRRV